MAKKAVEIESLLRWAYRDELPKRQGDVTWASMFNSAAWQLGARIDQTSSGEYAPVGAGSPHPDALLLDHVVRGLERIGGEVSAPAPILSERSGRRGFVRDRLDPMSAIIEYIGDGLPPGWVGDTRMALRAYEPASLVQMYSRLGVRPQWDLGPIRVEPARGGRKQAEVCFLDQEGNPISGSKRSGFYSSGASCLLRFEPHPFEIASARAEYLVWYISIARVAEQLSTLNLTDHRALKPSAAPLPWRSGEIDKPKILQEIPRAVASR